jgi:hypothetical protein
MLLRPAVGPTKFPVQWVPGPISPRLKQPGLEIHDRPATSAEVPVHLHGVVLTKLDKHRDSCGFVREVQTDVN